MKRIWLGPVLGSNRSRLIERCAGFVSEGKSDSFLYLTASHPLLELVTQGLLDGRTNHGVWGELPVYLFRGFVRRTVRRHNPGLVRNAERVEALLGFAHHFEIRVTAH